MTDISWEAKVSTLSGRALWAMLMSGVPFGFALRGTKRGVYPT